MNIFGYLCLLKKAMALRLTVINVYTIETIETMSFVFLYSKAS